MTDTAMKTTTTTWTIDPAHSVLEFAVKHMMFTTAKGRFSDFSGTITFDPKNVTASSVEVTIDTASIDTRTTDRDAHLRSADFFDVEQYPTASFRSTSVEADEADDDNFLIHGDLTIKGITKPITLKAEYEGSGVNPWGVEVAGFEAKGKFSRKDFGLNWNQALESGGVLVSDEVKLSIDVQAAKAQAEG
jgi:polyisoprenoid-binding protein YceI